jgi:hypothetical protein
MRLYDLTLLQLNVQCLRRLPATHSVVDSPSSELMNSLLASRRRKKYVRDRVLNTTKQLCWIALTIESTNWRLESVSAQHRGYWWRVWPALVDACGLRSYTQPRWGHNSCVRRTASRPSTSALPFCSMMSFGSDSFPTSLCDVTLMARILSALINRSVKNPVDPYWSVRLALVEIDDDTIIIP